jgi:tetratricopeptide (TPR) repeat protein
MMAGALAIGLVLAPWGAAAREQRRPLQAHDHSHEGHTHETPAKPAPAAPAQAKPAQATAAAAAADSLKALEAAAQKDTTSFDKAYRLGVAYLDRDKAADAHLMFARATRLRPNDVRGWVNRGASYDALGRGVDARHMYRKALGLSADDPVALCRLGASLYASGERAAAMDTLRLTLRKHPDSYCAYFTLGVAFADQQIYRDAIRAWEKVVAIAPGTPEALSAKESIETLRELIGLPPDSASQK